ncbi:tripartite tricarboxylate transporter TctB family protein [Silicimonas algicola]|uniref:Putative tricarboxylic transport membrane protein n=1 Tax=Silicimonas algicola TaxID=1826607 RepID=A0A316FZN7_9RHOB|nr:tripartite tricarboxylate transporter TctB family protein [Silicimonas algicola]AZQ68325.1 tripartite tricarboxylate transporter TctB family protein [Silicimonas algicola]PWK53605.1 putative tricarboxylic transport membrane protein [Silicimonas algicola]
MTNRLTGLIGLVFAITYGFTGAGISSRLKADPLGPDAFPVLLAVVLGLFCLALVIWPGSDASEQLPVSRSATIRAIIAVLVMVIYGIVLEYLGFIISSTLLVAVLVVLKRGTLLQAGTTGVASSVVLYLLFDRIFGLPLPTGAVIERLSQS